MQMRNAASVLPEPVGAEIRTSFPARISGHPRSCGSVGAPKRVENHSATRGSKADIISSILGGGGFRKCTPFYSGHRGSSLYEAVQRPATRIAHPASRIPIALLAKKPRRL